MKRDDDAGEDPLSARDRDGGAAAMAWLQHHFDGPTRVARDPKGLRLIIVNHFYDQDIEAFLAAKTDCAIWILHWSHVNGVRQYFEPEPDLEMSYDHPIVQRQIERATRSFVRPAVDYILEKTRAHAMLCPSDIFYWLRPFIAEFKKSGIKVFVQDKEGTIAPGEMTAEHLAHCISSYQPMADFYYSWGKVHRDAWVRAGLDPNSIGIFGMPRADLFMHGDDHRSIPGFSPGPGRRVVTCFTYENDVYLTAGRSRRDIGRPWQDMRLEMHQAIKTLAELWPDVWFIVKVHPQSQERDEILSELTPLADNVVFFEGAAAAASLINVSEFVIGFQTTALIEAMLNKKPILYCNWSKNIETFKTFLIPIDRSGCALISSSEHLVQLSNEILSGRHAVREDEVVMRQKFSEEYFYRADGNTSDRILSDIARRSVSRRNLGSMLADALRSVRQAAAGLVPAGRRADSA